MDYRGKWGLNRGLRRCLRAAEEDPEAALSWAESIENEGMRWRSLRRITLVYREQDPEGFEGWLGASGMSEEEKTAMRNLRGR